MFYKLSDAPCKAGRYVIPQVQKMNRDYNFDAPDSIWAVSRMKGKKVAFKPNLKTLILEQSTRPTDVITTSMLGGSGLFINDKLARLLTSFKLSDFQLFDAEVLYKGEILLYYWLHFYSDLRSFINFSKSEFRLGKEKIQFKSLTEMLKFQDDSDPFSQLRSNYIVLSNVPEMDLYYISSIDKKLYISSSFADFLLSNEITGIEIVPAMNFEIE